jgi:hypothetical protein
MDQLHFYTPIHRTCYNTALSQADSCFTVLNLFGIKRSNFVAACTGDSKHLFPIIGV